MTSNFDRRAQPEAAARCSRARTADRREPKLFQLLTNPAVWSISILTERMAANELISFKRSLADFAATRGLQVYAPGIVTCFVPTRGPITSDDRGAVLDWLCQSEKVTLVHILRRPRSLGEVAVTTFERTEPHGDGGSQLEPQRVADAPDLRQPEEEVSQEPAGYAHEMSQEQPVAESWDRAGLIGKPSRSRASGTPTGKAYPPKARATASQRALVRAQEKRHGR